MQEFLTNTYGVEVRQWAVPTEDGEVYEVAFRGRVIRADSATLVLKAVVECLPAEGQVIYLDLAA